MFMVELVSHKLAELGQPLRAPVDTAAPRKEVCVTTVWWRFLADLFCNPLGFLAKMKIGFHKSPDPGMRLLIRASGDDSGGISFGQEEPNPAKFKPVFEKRWGKVSEQVEKLDTATARRLYQYCQMIEDDQTDLDATGITVHSSCPVESDSELLTRNFPDHRAYLLPQDGMLHQKRQRCFRGKSFYDSETECQFNMFQNESSREIVLAFPGVTDDSKALQAADAIMGGIPSNFALADRIVSEIKNHLASLNAVLPEDRQFSLRLVGHSMGGAIAAYTGCKNGIPFTTFNPMSLGEGLLRDIGTERLRQANQLGDRYVNECDLVSDTTRGKGFVSWGLRTLPGEQKFLGRSFVIPAEYLTENDPKEIHMNIKKSLVGPWISQGFSGYSFEDSDFLPSDSSEPDW
jgi:hypothetical protein